MADFTFSFTHHEDFDNLLTDFGIDVDGLQSDSDTVPDDTVEDEQVYTQSGRSSWEPEDEAIHSVPELSHTEPLHTESSHTEPSHPTLHRPRKNSTAVSGTRTTVRTDHPLSPLEHAWISREAHKVQTSIFWEKRWTLVEN
jgi:hypothetical protein